MKKSRGQDQNGQAPSKGVAQGSIEKINPLFGQQANFPHVDVEGSALIAATINKHTDKVKKLLELNARVDVVDAQGKTALSHAVHHRHTDIGKLLVQAGADINARDASGITALTHAAFLRQKDIVDEVIALQADVNVTNAGGWSALALAGSDLGIVRSLLEAKADTAHEANRKVVLEAVRWGTAEAAQLLLKYGANPNAVDVHGKATLTHAVDKGDAGLVRSLIEAKADPNQGANQHALASPAAWSQAAVLQVLLEAGARPDISGPAGQNALSCAFRQDRADIVARWFPANSVQEPDAPGVWAYTPMPHAVTVGQASVVNVLRDAGHTIDVSDANGYNLLMLASAVREPRMVEALLLSRNGRSGADPNTKALLDGKTSLMFAAQMGNAGAMKLLLAAGARPDAVDCAGRSVLDHAIQCMLPAHRDTVQAIVALACAARLPQADFDEVTGQMLGHAAVANASSQGPAANWNDTLHDGAADTAVVGCAAAFGLDLQTAPTL